MSKCQSAADAFDFNDFSLDELAWNKVTLYMIGIENKTRWGPRVDKEEISLYCYPETH